MQSVCTTGYAQSQAVTFAASCGQGTDSGHRQQERPIVLITSHILMGHLSPMLRIASKLVTRGWEVAFLGPTAHRARIEATGAVFIALRGDADIYDKRYYEIPPTPDYATLHWSQRVCEDIRYQLVEPLPTAWECFTDALGALQSSNMGSGETSRREVVLLSEAFSWGVLPLFYGAKLPDGVNTPLGSLGVPGLDYPRSDWPPHLRFVGLAQMKMPTDKDELDDDVGFSWWEEILANSKLPALSPLRKKLLVVSQGTVEINPLDLIIPTLRAYANQADDVLAVAILGWKDANLEGYRQHFTRGELPSNARIADFLNYDTVLRHADVWIHNAGFGAVCHGIANGVPMVCAGEGMDKVDNARRVAWAGTGVDLQTQTPTADMVRRGVDRILSSDEGPLFRDKIMALRQESEKLQCFDAVENELLRLASRQHAS
ncbi:hypothetical protein Micbo1qcDRAFT_232586 [Microdochium bolleyi]|uniref:Erythromycin biosynthesis protein CIII-like C-terminal domain-containing protein n=1 Tax=Microdochium bolleyi TaxID=196109 RepID=A0A136J6W6_9PEZI|nr:hypothetical protein Micbo1qcDRAFT_232586 [Microdochium bolleyi]